MILLGLTGSIGMGKTETAKMFRRLGIPVYDADAAVHALYAAGGHGVGPIGAAFPAALREGAIDREALSREVLEDPDALKRLEGIIHPLVREQQMVFLREADRVGADIAVLDVPLLFETGGETRVDYVAVVSAPYEIQRERVLARSGMTETKFQSILAKQMPDAEKRARADFVIETDQGLDHAFHQVEAIVAALRSGAAGASRRGRTSRPDSRSESPSHA